MDPATEERISFPRWHPLISKLTSQLSRALYSHDSRNRIWVDKTGTKRVQKRVGDPDPPSPDLADALVLAYEAWSNFWDAPKQGRQYNGSSFLSG